MEEWAATNTQEMMDARDRVSVVLAKLAKPPAPDEIDDVTPPHMRRT